MVFIFFIILISGFIVYNKCAYWTSKESGIEIYKGIYTMYLDGLATVKPYANGYEYLEEYNKPALLKFYADVTLGMMDVGYTPLFCSLNKDRTMDIVIAQTASTDVFFPEAKVAFSDKDFKAIRVTITESEFKEIMDCTKYITKTHYAVDNKNVHFSTGGLHYCFYYKNKFYNRDNFPYVNDEDYKNSLDIYNKMYEVAGKYCDIPNRALDG